MSAYDTQRLGNSLGGLVRNDAPNSFVWEMATPRHSPARPRRSAAVGPGRFDDAPAWAGTSPIVIKSVTFGDGKAAKKWAVVSDFGRQGRGESDLRGVRRRLLHGLLVHSAPADITTASTIPTPSRTTARPISSSKRCSAAARSAPTRRIVRPSSSRPGVPLRRRGPDDTGVSPRVGRGDGAQRRAFLSFLERRVGHRETAEDLQESFARSLDRVPLEALREARPPGSTGFFATGSSTTIGEWASAVVRSRRSSKSSIRNWIPARTKRETRSAGASLASRRRSSPNTPWRCSGWRSMASRCRTSPRRRG